MIKLENFKNFRRYFSPPRTFVMKTSESSIFLIYRSLTWHVGHRLIRSEVSFVTSFSVLRRAPGSEVSLYIRRTWLLYPPLAQNIKPSVHFTPQFSSTFVVHSLGYHCLLMYCSKILRHESTSFHPNFVISKFANKSMLRSHFFLPIS